MSRPGLVDGLPLAASYPEVVTRRSPRVVRSVDRETGEVVDQLVGAFGEVFNMDGSDARGVRADVPDRVDRLVHAFDVASGSLRVRTSLAEPSDGPGADGALVAPRGGDRLMLWLVGVWAGMLAWPGEQLAFEELPDLRLARGVITGWSAKSRVRMMYRLSTLDWDAMPGIPEMVTLTYPGGWRRVCPDGETAKAHFEAFCKRWDRRWGDVAPLTGVWKMEFQRRGAPHFHVYAGRPVGPERAFRRWVSWAWACVVKADGYRPWFEAVDPADERQFAALSAAARGTEFGRHLLAGTGVDRQFCARARSVKALSWYFTKHNAKPTLDHYQHAVPDGFESVGRFWGVRRLPRSIDCVRLAVDDFVHVRRFIVSLRRAAGVRKARVRGRLIGAWTLADDPARLAVQMARWLAGGPAHERGRVRRGFAAVAPPIRPPTRQLAFV